MLPPKEPNHLPIPTYKIGGVVSNPPLQTEQLRQRALVAFSFVICNKFCIVVNIGNEWYLSK